MVRDLLYKALFPLVSRFLQGKFTIEAAVPEAVRALQPPYFLMSNHQGFWDPVMISFYLDRDVRFITTDAMFRSPFLKYLMNFLGAVPKRKARTDMNTMKQIMLLKKHGQVIGIFPEGQKTWDGVSLPLLFSTAKLVRKMAIPVVTVRIRGGYLSHPRWSVRRRRGSIKLEYRLLYQNREALALSSEKINEDLTEALFHDVVVWQRGAKQPFHGKRLAERVEQLLFLCPVCEGIGTLHSQGDHFHCRECSSGWMYDEYGFIAPAGSPAPGSWDGIDEFGQRPAFSSLRDWNRWQRKKLQKLLSGPFPLMDSGLSLTLSLDLPHFRRYPFRVSISLSPDRIFTIFSGSGKNRRVILQAPVSALIGINIQNREILELSHGGALYSIRDRGRRFSAYKWMVALDFLQRR
jgi:1-acyl-sn-glycerol-3-phosphate acyltransferase